jgi:hypothetical protein
VGVELGCEGGGCKVYFWKEGFVLKIVSNMERRDKDKPSKDLVCCMKV